VNGRKTAELLFAFRGEDHANLAAIGVVADALDEAVLRQAIDEADGAVMADEQMLGQLSDGRAVPVRKSSDGEQDLVLLRLEALGPGRLFAEVEEAADLVTEFA
jgi:hypothetical protein